MENAWRILVVDDEPRGVELIKRALLDVGEVETALSGEDGWEIASRGGIDLVVADQRMPGMSGVEFLARVAEASDLTGRIVLTGYADINAAIDAINNGRVHAYLTKPCPPEQLEMTVRSVLDRIRLARENERLVGELSEMVRKLEQTLHSLSETQQRLVASERLAAIGRVSAMIVHDLRGPMTVLRSSGAEVIRDGQAARNGSLEELGLAIVEEVDRMNRTCRELLEVAQASEGELRPTEEDLDAVVRAVAGQIAGDASRSGVLLDLELGCGRPVPLDEGQVRRALFNLASNAIDAMPEGGLLRIVTRCEEGSAVVSFIDTGSGIPEEIRDNLFDPFVTAGKAGGTGLGLTVVKVVVERHHGEIEVGKAEGGETAFHLRLPLDPSGDG